MNIDRKAKKCACPTLPLTENFLPFCKENELCPLVQGGHSKPKVNPRSTEKPSAQLSKFV